MGFRPGGERVLESQEGYLLQSAGMVPRAYGAQQGGPGRPYQQELGVTGELHLLKVVYQPCTARHTASENGTTLYGPPRLRRACLNACSGPARRPQLSPQPCVLPHLSLLTPLLCLLLDSRWRTGNAFQASPTLPIVVLGHSRSTHAAPLSISCQ